MKTPVFRGAAIAAILVAGAALPARAAIVPQGDDFRVNVDYQNHQKDPVAASDAQGNTLVVWQNDLDGLRGRLFTAAGAPLSSELALVDNQNLPTIPAHGVVVTRRDPAAVFVPSGDFMLFWTEETAFESVDILFENYTTTDRKVFMQLFTPSGAPATRAMQVNQTTVGYQARPKAVLRPSGDVLVVWDSNALAGRSIVAGDGIFGRLFTASGRPKTAEFKVSGDGLKTAFPSVAVDAAGRFLVTWEGRGNGSVDVFGRLFDASARAVAPSFQISTATDGPQRFPSVGASADGSFLVAWQGWFQDVWHGRVFGRAINRTGVPTGPQVQISKGNGYAQVAPTVAPATANSFLVVWMEFGQFSFPLGVAGVQVSLQGAPLSNEAWINQNQSNVQTTTSAATDGDGHFIIPFEEFIDNNTAGISARRVAVQ